MNYFIKKKMKHKLFDTLLILIILIKYVGNK
jgi:hypothetical protein